MSTLILLSKGASVKRKFANLMAFSFKTDVRQFNCLSPVILVKDGMLGRHATICSLRGMS